MNVFLQAHLTFARANQNLAIEKLDNAINAIKSNLNIYQQQQAPESAIKTLQSELAAIENVREIQQEAIDHLSTLINVD